jgi:hypothetical protein
MSSGWSRNLSDGGCWLQSNPSKPELERIKPGDKALPADAFLGLLKSILARNVPFRFRARGFSMTPFIRNGDIVTIHPPGGTEIEAGDVVAVEAGPGKLVLHRVIEKSGSALVIKGDNLAHRDGTISETLVIGIVRQVERKGKAVSFGSGAAKGLVTGLSRSGSVIPLAVRTARAIRSLFGRRGR